MRGLIFMTKPKSFFKLTFLLLSLKIKFRRYEKKLGSPFKKMRKQQEMFLADVFLKFVKNRFKLFPHFLAYETYVESMFSCYSLLSIKVN